MISIVGCGWLGQHLAKRLLGQEDLVLGSTTRKEQLDLLNSLGVKSSILTVSESGDVSVDSDDIFLSPTLIITLPFRRWFKDPMVYFKQIKALVEYYCDLNTSKKWIIFTSSTSIYSMTNKTVKEDDAINLVSDRQHVLYDVEQYLLSLPNVDATVLRCAGLYGYDRRIAHFLSGKVVSGRDACVNLIHIDDVVGIVDLVLNQCIKNHIINCVTNHHPTKEELYSFHSKKDGLNAPVFQDDGSQAKYKIVSNDRLVNELQYSFQYTNLFSDYA